MSRTFEVLTPEQVAIRYELAGFGSRAVAAIIDSLLQLAAIVAILFVFLLISQIKLTDSHVMVNRIGKSVAIGVALLIFFILSWGYYIAFEFLWNGATPGKRLLGLRVIKDGGHPVDFRAVVIRNLVRAVDILPGMLPIAPLYGFAFIAVLTHAQYKRLGDMAAGTLVVRQGHDEELEQGFSFGETEVFRLLDATVLSQLAQVTRDEAHVVQRFLARREQLPPALRAEFARRLAAPLMEKFAYQPPTLGFDTERWLDELSLAYRNRALGISTSTVAAPAPPTIADAPPTPDLRKW